jgi:hypothetical protein
VTWTWRFSAANGLAGSFNWDWPYPTVNYALVSPSRATGDALAIVRQSALPYSWRIGIEGGPALNTDLRELERQAEARAHVLETSLTLVLVGPLGIGLALLLFSGLL